MGCSSGKSKPKPDNKGDKEKLQPLGQPPNLKEQSNQFTLACDELIGLPWQSKFEQMKDPKEIINQYAKLNLPHKNDFLLVAHNIYKKTVAYITSLDKKKKPEAESILKCLNENFSAYDISAEAARISGKTINAADQVLFVIHSAYHAVQVLQKDQQPQPKYWFASVAQLSASIKQAKDEMKREIDQQLLGSTQPQKIVVSNPVQQEIQVQVNQQMKVFQKGPEQEVNGASAAEKKNIPHDLHIDHVQDPVINTVCNQYLENLYKEVIQGQLDEEENVEEDENYHGGQRTHIYQFEAKIKPIM